MAKEEADTSPNWSETCTIRAWGWRAGTLPRSITEDDAEEAWDLRGEPAWVPEAAGTTRREDEGTRGETSTRSRPSPGRGESPKEGEEDQLWAALISDSASIARSWDHSYSSSRSRLALCTNQNARADRARRCADREDHRTLLQHGLTTDDRRKCSW